MTRRLTDFAIGGDSLSSKIRKSPDFNPFKRGF